MVIRHFAALLWVVLASAASASAIDSKGEADRAFASAREALIQKNYQQAELFLERTLMYQPEHAEARIELALLLASRGRLEAALLFIESLVQDPRTTPDYRARLLALSRSVQADLVIESARPTQIARPWQGQADLSIGFQQNPLAGTSASSLLLTLPGGTLELPVEDQVESAAVLRVSGQLSHRNGLYLEAQAQAVLGGVKRHSGRLLLSNNIKEVAQGVVSLGFTAERTPFSDQNRGIFASWTSAHTRLSTQIYDSPSQERSGFLVRWDESVWAHKFMGLDTSVTSFVEHEWALKSGPDQTRFGARSLLKSSEKTNIWLSLSVHRDQTGYSLFLEDGRRREMATVHTQLEHQLFAPSPHQALVLQAHLTRRWASLNLFRFEDAGVAFAFRQLW